MTRAKAHASRIRRIILIAGIVYALLALTWMVLPLFMEQLPDVGFAPAGLIGTPFALTDPSTTGYVGVVLLLLAALLFAAWAFLRPSKQWGASLARTGRPLRSAVLVAAAMAMLLSVGLIAIILELPDWWAPLVDPESNAQRAVFRVPWVFVVLFGGMVALWIIWAVVFFIYWRQGDRYTQLGCMIRGLVAGSLLEATVAVPVHVWAARQRECYCARGTYTAFVFSGIVLLWAFGPGIILLYKREWHRRAKLIRVCHKCDYDLTGNVSGVCPECGTPVEAKQ